MENVCILFCNTVRSVLQPLEIKFSVSLPNVIPASVQRLKTTGYFRTNGRIQHFEHLGEASWT